ncbi:MAG: nitroreductase family protein [Fibrobacter sp.]|nr:nitroreductase family protein [Fibrobacter sp.]
MESFYELAKNRYSCRFYSEKAVEPEVLAQILETGRIAPTATNSQPVRVFVLKSEGSLAKIREATRMVYNAPVVLMVCYDISKSYKAEKYNDPHDCGLDDACIVATHMMLQAKDLGLETVWARGFNAMDIEKAFEFPPELKLACLMDLGYADPEHGKPTPRHFQRNPVEDFAKEI